MVLFTVGSCLRCLPRYTAVLCHILYVALVDSNAESLSLRDKVSLFCFVFQPVPQILSKDKPTILISVSLCPSHEGSVP